VLTAAGYDAVVAAAPGHVRRVRELVVDVVDPDGLAALRRVCEQVLAQIDPDRSC